MRTSLLSLAAAALLLTGASIASAQTTTTTTTTWTTDQGAVIREYYTTRHDSPFIDPAMKPVVGMTLPGTVTLYPLPETMKIPEPDRYSYSIINGQPVVVERTNRRVIYTWQ